MTKKPKKKSKLDLWSGVLAAPTTKRPKKPYLNEGRNKVLDQIGVDSKPKKKKKSDY